MTGKTNAFPALALMVIGSLMGYLAATSERSRTGVAAPSSTDSRPAAELAGRSSCCPEETGRGALLALAGRDEAARTTAIQDGKKPSILVIFGDDIGQTNVSAYSMGLMGYGTPNIDRI